MYKYAGKDWKKYNKWEGKDKHIMDLDHKLRFYYYYRYFYLLNPTTGV